MKKLAAAILALVMCLSLIPAAMAQGNNDEPMTINWAFSNYSAHEDYDTSSGVYARINEKFNVNIVPFPTNYLQNSEQFTMKMASGEIPDVWYDWNTRTWHEQGLIRTVTLEMIKEHMPYLYNNVLLPLDPDLVTIMQRTLDDGSILGFPSMGANSSPFARLYRQDWLDALGMEAPKTLDEFAAYVEAVATKDPDGNGADDTYALIGHEYRFFADIIGAFGLPTGGGYMLDAEGKVVHSQATEQYKNLIKLLAEWYAAGYLPPEMLTTAGAEQTQLFASGKLGSWYSNSFNLNPDYENSAMYALRQADPDMTYAWGTALTGPNGEAGAFTFGYDSGWTLVFGVNTSDETTIKIMEIINYLNTPDGWMDKFGEEGTDYHITDGTRVVTLIDGGAAYTIGQDVFPSMAGPETMKFALGEGDYYNLHLFCMEQPIYVDLLKGWTFEKAKESGVGQDISTPINEFFWNCVMGMTDVETGWDEYISTLEANGLRELEAEANEIYEAKIKK